MQLHGINIADDRIADLCRRHRVRRLWLFGSILGNDFRPDSDVDVLVDMDPATPVGLFALGGLAADLQDLIGREVHLTTLGGVPSSAQPGLLRAARLQYAA